MTGALGEHIIEGGHWNSVGNQFWRDTYAFVPSKTSSDGLAVLAGSTETAYVQIESAKIQWGGEPNEFVSENPGYGRVIGVANSENVYEKKINERLPLTGLRLEIARRRATKKVCTTLGIDPKPNFKQPEYKGLKDHLKS
jgi:hypothetical protein